MSEKFTKGPWKLHHRAYCCVTSLDDTLICNAGQRDRSFNQEELHIEQSSNASLIAAAPDMYALLKKLQIDGGLGVARHREIDRILAKARGEL